MVTTSATVNVSDYVHRQKPLWNSAAIAYSLIGYLGGIALLLQANGWLNAIGVLLFTHVLVWSAYLAHEFMHSTIFATRRANAIAGTIMLWITGACYSRFDRLAKEHIAHHVNRIDFAAFDLPAAMQQLPTWLRRGILLLEGLYFPVISFWLQWRSILAVFRNRDRHDERLRVTLLLLIRVTLFALLAFISLKALLLYFLSYIGMITILRWQDAFQHTYEVFPTSSPLPTRDRAHEQANTFSTLLTRRYGWLNLLLLNFGYHNAHHELMKCPWHALPDLDRQLFSGAEVHYVPLSQLLRNYHRFRTSRIFSGQGQAVDDQGNPAPETFYGAIGVSHLVQTY
ncbi:MAG: fatty acid desaturase [Microcoleus sp. SIO2G3]|nr:fatty acid desaturase [Microcoleus sp. SIO2G3]